MCLCAPQHAPVPQISEEILELLTVSFFMWVPRIELSLSGLVARAFISSFVTSFVPHFSILERFSQLLELTIVELTQLAAQLTPGIRLSLLPQYWNYKHSLSCPAFNMDAGTRAQVPMVAYRLRCPSELLNFVGQCSKGSSSQWICDIDNTKSPDRMEKKWLQECSEIGRAWKLSRAYVYPGPACGTCRPHVTKDGYGFSPNPNCKLTQYIDFFFTSHPVFVTLVRT